MKMLFITRKYPPQVGGMENFSYNLAKNMKCNMKIVALKKSNKHLIWFIPYAMIYLIINAHKYDVIYLADMVLCSFGWISKLIYPKKKVVVTIHGLDITYQSKIYQLYLKVFGHKCDKYICDSNNTRKLAKEIGIKNLITIPLGVEVEKFKNTLCDKDKFKENYNIPKEHTILITTGRLVERKGVLWFVDNVMPYYKGKNITYLIVGKGENYDKIQTSIDANNLNEQARLLGRVDDDELMDIYVNSDIFIMPNIVVKNDVEGFGLVALEAALAENVVVGSNIQGIKDAIINFKNGILIESENSRQYIDTINEIINNKDKYKKFAIDASNFTIENCSWEHVCNLYLKEIKKLIGC